MDDIFGGDYAKALEAHKNIQGLQAQTATKNNELTAQNADLQSQIAKLSAASTPAPPTTTGTNTGGSLYDWHNGSMRDASGQVDQGLMAAMEKAGATPEVVQSMVGTIEQAKSIIQTQAQQTVVSQLGSQENYEALKTWVSTTKTPEQLAAINPMLDNPNTVAYALQGLKAEYEAAGNSFTTQEATPAVGATEPSPLPNTTGGGYSGLTPLKPNTPEALEALAEVGTDPAKMQQFEQRIALGMKST